MLLKFYALKFEQFHGVVYWVSQEIAQQVDGSHSYPAFIAREREMSLYAPLYIHQRHTQYLSLSVFPPAEREKRTPCQASICNPLANFVILVKENALVQIHFSHIIAFFSVEGNTTDALKFCR